MSKELLAVRVPKDIVNSVEQQVQQTGLSKTDVVLEMLQQSVPSLPITERSKLPNTAAIYFVFTLDNKLLYIGQTSNLRQRWAQHHRYQQFIEASSQTRIGWFAFGEEFKDSLLDIEKELIESLSSEHNDTPHPGLVSLRIPDELLQWVEETSDVEYSSSRSGRAGANRTQVILDALEFYRQHRNTVLSSSSTTANDSVTKDELQESIESAITALRKELEQKIAVK